MKLEPLRNRRYCSAMRRIMVFQVPFLAAALMCSNCGETKKQQPDPKPATQNPISLPVQVPEQPRKATVALSPETEAPMNMLPVPGGTFTMGLNHPKAIPDEMFEHQVTLEGFFLDKTEVTNAAYSECVDAGACRKPKRLSDPKDTFAPEEAFRRPDRPVCSISQSDAAAYCKWRGKRLPTEAEFERAARGSDNRMYAWGNQEPNADLAVYGVKVTGPIGSKPKGAGPYGHLDLAGNVWEWTSDLYDPQAYRRSSAKKGVPGTCPQIKRTQDMLRKKGSQGFTGKNPIPTECEHTLRGGAFNYFPWGLRASNRVHHPGSWRMIMAGFRCAASK